MQSKYEEACKYIYVVLACYVMCGMCWTIVFTNFMKKTSILPSTHLSSAFTNAFVLCEFIWILCTQQLTRINFGQLSNTYNIP